MAKGLTRRITRKQALSYTRTRPNGIGVTAIASVNGRGARRRKRKGPPAAVKTAMKACGKLVKSAWKKAKKTKGRARKNGAGRIIGDAASWSAKDLRWYASRSKSAGIRRKAAAELRRRGLKPNQAAAPAPKTATANYNRRYAQTKRVLRNLARNPEETAMQKNKKRGKKRSKKRLKGAAFKRSAQYKKMQAGLRKFRAKKGGGKRKKSSGRKTSRKSARKGSRRKARRSTSAARGLTVSIGGKRVKTYLTKGKGGRVKHLPEHAIMGFKSRAAMKAVIDMKQPRGKKKMSSEALRRASDRLVNRLLAVGRARERAARRVEKHGDIFTPNTTVVPYSQWSENMKANRRRKKSKGRRRQTAKQKAASLRNLRKARAARRAKKSGTRKRRRKGGARKAARRRTKKATTTRRRRRKSSAKRRGTSRKRRKGGAKRRRTSTRRRRSGKGRRRTARRRGTSRKAARRALRTLSRYKFNGRRRRSGRRRYRRNSAFMEQLKQGLKLGAVVVGGFIAHKALSKVLNDHVLSKISAISTGAAAPYSSLIAGAIVAAAGIPLAAKVLSREKALNVGAGIAASFLHSLVVTVLGKANQPAVAAYFSGYPDRSGSAMQGYGEYFIPPGMGEYFLPPGMNGFGAAEIMQAAAGYGDPAIMQAAAGMGADQIMQAAAGMGAPMLTQAAAGTGEYMLTGGNAYGEYEMVNAGPISGMGYTDEGIMGGDLNAAEYALNQAEAAAGIGDIPLISTVDPTMVAQPVEDVPGGMRSGILQGSDGIFG